VFELHVSASDGRLLCAAVALLVLLRYPPKDVLKVLRWWSQQKK
jgi:hypothetical protein